MPIKEFVGLRSKLYVYTVGDVDEKRAKGVDKNVVKTTLLIEDYKKVLMDGTRVHRRMQVIASNRHQTYTMEINKVALNRNDDKRIIREDGIATLPYGHHGAIARER